MRGTNPYVPNFLDKARVLAHRNYTKDEENLLWASRVQVIAEFYNGKNFWEAAKSRDLKLLQFTREHEHYLYNTSASYQCK